jgi:hypothetical protein
LGVGPTRLPITAAAAGTTAPAARPPGRIRFHVYF